MGGGTQLALDTCLRMGSLCSAPDEISSPPKVISSGVGHDVMDDCVQISSCPDRPDSPFQSARTSPVDGRSGETQTRLGSSAKSVPPIDLDSTPCSSLDGTPCRSKPAPRASSLPSKATEFAARQAEWRIAEQKLLGRAGRCRRRSVNSTYQSSS